MMPNGYPLHFPRIKSNNMVVLCVYGNALKVGFSSALQNQWQPLILGMPPSSSITSHIKQVADIFLVYLQGTSLDENFER
jgi:hypothetical protein